MEESKERAVILVRVQGCIGVGKSTLLRQLQTAWGEEALYFAEPVAEWQNVPFVDVSKGSFDALSDTYKAHQTRFALQTLIMSSFAKRSTTLLNDVLKQLASSSGKPLLCVMERSLEACSLFHDFAHSVGELDDREAAILNQIQASYLENERVIHGIVEKLGITIHCVDIFLEAPVETLKKRVAKRRRPGESEVNIDALRRFMHTAYKTWSLADDETTEKVIFHADDTVGERVRKHLETRYWG